MKLLRILVFLSFAMAFQPQTKEELQTSMEEIETSNEELQAANEELLASNEELQSTNEELQSVNFKHALGQLTTTHVLKSLKKDIARLKTILRQRALNAEG